MHSRLRKVKFWFNLNWLIAEQPIYHLIFLKSNLRLELWTLALFLIWKKNCDCSFFLMWDEENVRWRILPFVGGAAMWFIELVIVLFSLFELKLLVVCFLTLGCKVITFLLLDGSESTSLIELTVLEFVLVVKGQVAVVNRVMKLLVA